MLNRLTKLFAPDSPEKKAEIAFARLISQFQMESLPYREGLAASRRGAHSQQVAIGVWLVPCSDSGQGDFENAIPGVTFDLRRMGIGVLAREKLTCKTVVVAIPDKEDVWRYFDCQVRHRSKRNGGWSLIGLQLRKVVDPMPSDLKTLRMKFDSPEVESPDSGNHRW